MEALVESAEVGSAEEVTALSNEIACRTLDASRTTLRDLHNNEGVRRAVAFLVALSVGARSGDVRSALQEAGLSVDRIDDTPIDLAKNLNSWIRQAKLPSPENEFATLASQAASETIVAWSRKATENPQLGLFESSKEPYDAWRTASDGRGFCDLSRLFFASFTRRYLSFYLDKAASDFLPSIAARERLSSAIRTRTDEVAEHSFETSKLLQSYSAGWFNKRAVERMPDRQEISGFLAHGLSKLAEEFRRERSAV